MSDEYLIYLSNSFHKHERNQKDLMVYKLVKPINYIVCQLYDPKNQTTASEKISVQIKTKRTDTIIFWNFIKATPTYCYIYIDIIYIPIVWTNNHSWYIGYQVIYGYNILLWVDFGYETCWGYTTAGQTITQQVMMLIFSLRPFTNIIVNYIGSYQLTI